MKETICEPCLYWQGYQYHHWETREPKLCAFCGQTQKLTREIDSAQAEHYRSQEKVFGKRDLRSAEEKAEGMKAYMKAMGY